MTCLAIQKSVFIWGFFTYILIDCDYVYDMHNL